MHTAGVIKLVKLLLRDIKAFFLEALLGKFRPAHTMLSIVSVILALAVMEKGKKPHHRNIGARHRRKQKPVEFHLPPMSKTVVFRIDYPVLKDKIL